MEKYSFLAPNAADAVVCTARGRTVAVADSGTMASTRVAQGSSKSGELDNFENFQMSSTNNNLVVRRKSKATEEDNTSTVQIQQQQPDESFQPRSVPEQNSLPKQVNCICITTDKEHLCSFTIN